MSHLRWLAFVLTLVALIFCAPPSAQAATSTWNGNGGNVNWSAAGNWTGGTPTSANTTDLIFAGTTNLGTSGTPLNQDIASPMLLNSLTFSSEGGAFFLGGNGLRFEGITNTIAQISSSAENIANAFAAPSTNSLFTITLAGNGSGLVTLAGVISAGAGNSDYAIVKTAGSTFAFTGTNTYSGGTAINGGTLIVNSAASLGATSGALTLHAGTLEVSNGFSTSRSITVGNAASTFQIDPSQTYTVTSAIGGNGALNKTGSGTMVLSGANTYTGATTINAGTLIAAATSGSALASTTSIAVNSGGTLLLGASDQINSSATISLGGGTFAKGNFSEGTTSSVGLGALTLTTTGSTIDFGTGTVGVTTFASFNPGANTLAIDNWTGTANTIGNAGTDRLVFDSNQTSNLNNFNFTGFAPGAVEFDLGGGFFEIAPLGPVPEPSTWCAAAFAAAMIGFQLRHRVRTAIRKFIHRLTS